MTGINSLDEAFANDFAKDIISLESDILSPKFLEIINPYKVIAVGEMHGSCEIPRFFGRLVSALVNANELLTVGLEISRSNQAVFDQFLETGDEGLLSRAQHFSSPTNDGRSSMAIHSLVKDLAGSHVANILAFDIDYSFHCEGEQQRDSAMAKHILAHMKENPKNKVLLLCGNIHSAATIGTFFDLDFKPLVYELGHLDETCISPTDIFSIAVDFDSGETWSQSNTQPEPTMRWASSQSPFSTLSDLQSYFVAFKTTKFRGHDALVFFKTVSASPPFSS